MTCYMTKIRPLLEYGSPVWGGIPQYLVDELESIQARSLRILGIPKDSLYHHYMRGEINKQSNNMNVLLMIS